MIFNLKSKLAEWQSSKLISAQQVEDIMAHEGGTGRPWVLYGIVGIGVSTLATGIISIIAANWETIPEAMKIALYFLVQSAAGAWVYRQWDKRSAWREGAIVLFSLLFFSGMGLFGQIFHLHSQPWRALALWVFMCFPLTLAARNRISHHLWVLLILQAGSLWAQNRHSIAMPMERISIVAAIPFLLTAFGFFGQNWRGFPEGLRQAILFWGLFVTLVTSVPLANGLWVWMDRPLPADVHRYLMIPWAALLLAAFASYTRKRPSAPALPKLTALLLVAAGVYLTLPLLGIASTMDSMVTRQIVGAAGFIAIASLAAAVAAIGHYQRYFDAVSFLIAGRFIVVYFEVFGSLIRTGVGLILSGTVILGVAGVWYRYRGSVLKQIVRKP